MENKNKCIRCKEVKEVKEFYKSSANKTGLQSYCKACALEYNKENRSSYIYIIKRFQEDLYVGSCADISRRVSRHVTGDVSTTKEYMLNGEWTSIFYLDVAEYVSNRLEREFLEYAVIELICPSLNILDMESRNITLNNAEIEEKLMEVAQDLVNSDLFKVYKENRKDLQ